MLQESIWFNFQIICAQHQFLAKIKKIRHKKYLLFLENVKFQDINFIPFQEPKFQNFEGRGRPRLRRKPCQASKTE